MVRISALFCIAALLSAGCGQAEDAAKQAGQWTAKATATIEGFKVPECVALDPQTGLVYVSNVETDKEGYWEDDGKGFISRLKADGKLDALRWVDSSKAAPIHAPKGMCVLGGNLYVADLTRVLRIALDGKQPPVVVAIPGAKMLNDMASDGTAAYVSDTETGLIHRLDADGPKALKGPKAANGITFFGDKMFAVSWSLHEVYEVDKTGKQDPQPFGVERHFQNLDGLEVLDDGTFIVSDFTGNKVCAIAPDRKTVTVLAELQSPADIGLDRRNSLLYVPQFLGDRVLVFGLLKK